MAGLQAKRDLVAAFGALDRQHAVLELRVLELRPPCRRGGGARGRGGPGAAASRPRRRSRRRGDRGSREPLQRTASLRRVRFFICARLLSGEPRAARDWLSRRWSARRTRIRTVATPLSLRSTPRRAAGASSISRGPRDRRPVERVVLLVEDHEFTVLVAGAARVEVVVLEERAAVLPSRREVDAVVSRRRTGRGRCRRRSAPPSHRCSSTACRRHRLRRRAWSPPDPAPRRALRSGRSGWAPGAPASPSRR